MDIDILKSLLEQVKDGSVDVDDAMRRLRSLPYEDMGFAKIDNHRHLRTGFPEVVFCQGKTTEQVCEILKRLSETNKCVLGTRASPAVFRAVSEQIPDASYSEMARIITVGRPQRSEDELAQDNKYVMVLCAGTADLPVAEEAAERYRLAAANPAKLDVLARLCAMHREDNVLIIGQYLDQLRIISEMFQAPIVTGQTSIRERERLYDGFRRGEIKLLVVSKVANFALDLPEANVAIQVSGTFGSRQEEAQRLGRILRPKANGGQAHFYSVVTRETSDQDFAANRQLFLTEQGYRYTILDATHLLSHRPNGRLPN